MSESPGSESPGGPVRLAAVLDDGPPGAPVLVLGNSLGTSAAVWEPQLAAFRARFRVLRYEHRGHGTDLGQPGIGRSPAPPGPYTIAELGADVLAVLDAHGVERALYCGISLGGMVGLWLAANAPGRIARLALCCTSAYLPPPQGWAERAARARAGEMTALASQVVERWFTPAFRARVPEVPAAFAAGLAATDPDGYAGCCEAIAAMDLRPALRSVTAPTLVIAAAEDPATPPWHGAAIASGIGGSALRVIRGAAHLANVSAPGPVTAALLAHLTAAPVT
ncbi:MAG: 3-oxoadipate enol-lactonase [Streptosporangiaceae bacterium]